jgi:hypothetical protein
VPGKAVLGATSHGPRFQLSVIYLACSLSSFGETGGCSRERLQGVDGCGRVDGGNAHTRVNTHNITGFFSFCGK